MPRWRFLHKGGCDGTAHRRKAEQPAPWTPTARRSTDDRGWMNHRSATVFRRRENDGEPVNDRRLRSRLTRGEIVRIAPGSFAETSLWRSLTPARAPRAACVGDRSSPAAGPGDHAISRQPRCRASTSSADGRRPSTSRSHRPPAAAPAARSAATGGTSTAWPHFRGDGISSRPRCIRPST